MNISACTYFFQSSPSSTLYGHFSISTNIYWFTTILTGENIAPNKNKTEKISSLAEPDILMEINRTLNDKDIYYLVSSSDKFCKEKKIRC